jgi:hypothetical protein
MFQNRVLRRTVGLKKDGVTGGWRKLHNEELHNLYSLQSIIRMTKSRRMRWAGPTVHMGEMIFVGEPEGRRLGKHRHKWKDNIKMDLTERGWGGTNLIDLAQDRDQWKALVNNKGTSGSIKYWEVLE